MQKREAEILFKKYKEGKASVKDINKLLMWAQQFEEVSEVDIPLKELEKIEAELAASLPMLKPVSARLQMWPKLAAAVMIIFILGIVLLTVKPGKNPNNITINIHNDVGPGVNQATLTLSNGKKVILTKTLKGNIALQGNTSIDIRPDSSIAYVSTRSSNRLDKVGYNTLSTGKGEQSPFPLVLADGTKVWLNAASSLIFPTSFNENIREVRLIGEAYFKVAHNSKKLFIVRSGEHIVQDIGTEFNVSSYADEHNIRTTLVEGAVKVTANGESKILKPGEQTNATSTSLLVSKGDIESDIAWLNGKFIFHDEELHSVMRKLSRWYNIEVKYEYDPKGIVFGGVFSKDRTILKILDALEQTGSVKFRISGKTVIVTK